jgi:hypothetical protein
VFAGSMRDFVQNPHMNPRLLGGRALREVLGEQVDQLVYNKGITLEQAARERLASIGMKPAVIEEFAPLLSKAINCDPNYGAMLEALEEKHGVSTATAAKAAAKAASASTNQTTQAFEQPKTTAAVAESTAIEKTAAHTAASETSWLTRTLGKHAGWKAGAIGVGAAALVSGGIYVANEMKRRENKSQTPNERSA